MSEEKPKIKFNGKEYDLVSVGEMTIDEGMVLWDYAKISPDQVSEQDGMPPGVAAALIHVAIARAEPTRKAREIRAVVVKKPLVELVEIFADFVTDEEEDADVAADPPAAPALETEPDVRSEPFGPDSPLTSPTPGLAVIEGNGSGPPGSDTSAPSAPATSVTEIGQAAG